MSSNLPPGVTETMIPGNRPEDIEVFCDLVLTVGEIEDIIDCAEKGVPMERYIREELAEQLQPKLQDLQ